ncbi:MAG: M24 family metallopeptidase, partial [Acidimicrobiia bacterium]|nr:M24 family metallopeptidase [Acidimicrobiia bacterium]
MKASAAGGSGPVAADLPPLRLGGRANSVRGVLAAGVTIASESGAEGNGADAAPVDALVVTDLANGRWLTGFSGSAMVVVITADDLLVITDGRYATQAPAELEAAGVEGRVTIVDRGSKQQEAATAAVEGLGRLALEADNVSWSRYRRFAGEWFPDAELVPSTGVIERLRRTKSPEEVARMAAAAAIADDALAEALPRLAEGPTEAEVAAELDHLMRRLGASGSAFETIVAARENSALPHARP